MARIPVLGRRRRTRDQRGAVAVEFALVTPLLLILVFGIIEFGFLLNRDTIVNNASRDGARVGSLGGSFSDICTQVKNELSASNITVPTSCNTTSTPTTITIDCIKADSTACGATSSTYDTLAVSGTTVTVKVVYKYSLITPIVSSFIGNPVTLSQYTQMVVE